MAKNKNNKTAQNAKQKVEFAQELNPSRSASEQNQHNPKQHQQK